MPEDFTAQRKELEQAVLQTKKGAAFEAFRRALQERMEKEGKLQYNQANVDRLTNPA
jgi:hypothetical protein